MTLPRLAFTPITGPERAPLLVLGPSLGTSTILWERVTPGLATRYRVTAWDLPGHGGSATVREAFTVGDLADAVAAAVPEPFLHAGVSLGGATGLELLLRHPAQVRAGAVLASGARLGTPEGWAERAAKVRAQSTSSIIIASAQRWFAADSVAREPESTGRLLHALQDADDESYALCCEALAAYDVRARLSEIGAPVLAAWGEDDAVAPRERSVEIASGVRHGRLAKVVGAAHLPPTEQPAATAALLLDFFDLVDFPEAS